MGKCDACNHPLMYQQSLWREYDGYPICPKCGTERTAKRSSTKPTKVIDYKILQDKLFKYKQKLLDLNKQIQQHGEDPSLVDERTWCNFIEKQLRPELGLLGYSQEDYQINKSVSTTK